MFQVIPDIFPVVFETLYNNRTDNRIVRSAQRAVAIELIEHMTTETYEFWCEYRDNRMQ